MVAVYDGIEMRVYVDGIKSPTVYSQEGAIQWVGDPLYLGRGDLEYFEGDLDEVRLYAGALSEDEIFAHYRKMMDVDVDIIIGVAPAFVAEIPGDVIRIGDAAPNPFHGRTHVDYRLLERNPVTASVYDVSGRRVRRLLGGDVVEPGIHGIHWDGRNDRGAALSAGVYFLRISVGPDTRGIV